MTKRSGPIVGDRRNALVGGLVCYLVGSLLLWDAYEHRGKDRPFVMRIFGGLV